MNKKQIISILAIVLVIIVALSVFFKFKSQSAVELKASLDKASYKTGETINLSVNLKNIGKTATCVSNMSIGSLRFVSLTRDGAQVENRSAPSYFITSFPMMLQNSLVSIDSEKSIDFTLKSELDDGLGKKILRIVELVDGRGVSTFYNVETPGDYKFELVYKYTGPASQDCAKVFKSDTNKAEVTFTITP
ncbi:MAG: hypothetical protein A2418_00540 [Candidatus Brennerbacteria bacterium RIFOXYC1_FULL_41_11]|uniref:Uncharacterized protein n=1 Tax=Candidatus Brennerbacteria bacterium RIFOXYD1_FULL_41_16 TaxID=1797529 RepID=A0A1G1XLZ6_9BACT|nr:MAG: hypothetical protein A2391_02000 [Candidatus Brennerbacteria bacterium RIFOXYB1_FULL_41_13]OGY39723.1 MAG: hypothetical protein A2418_00540 [Candidatus Brennerbacteria bacterium RIFOXYC1_FULL_41_11]OGY40347.1 MAG: hypothetical protein A2570_03665 [Candidatus Brennerbacteria bacterium RIFOXYD1_FULL_41_16]